MSLPRSADDMRRRVSCALLDTDEGGVRLAPTLERVQDAVFGKGCPDENSLQLLRTIYAAELGVLALAECKKDISMRMNPNDAKKTKKTIATYDECTRDDKYKFFNKNKIVYPMLEALKDEKLLGNLMEKVDDYFRQVKSVVRQTAKEDAFRDVLVNALKCGGMTKKEWELIRKWKEEGGTMLQFRNIFQRSEKGLKKVLKAANEIGEEFTDLVKIRRLLERFCESTNTVQDGKVTVIGRTIFLSDCLVWIEEQLRAGARSVTIHAKDYFGLDPPVAATLTLPPFTGTIWSGPVIQSDSFTPNGFGVWSGVNLILITGLLDVLTEAHIDLSGRSGPLNDVLEKGADGPPGASSGNLSICADQISNGRRLRVRLDGARGMDGADGVNGAEGEDGKGVSMEEILACYDPNLSLSSSPWEEFLEHTPREIGGRIKEKYYRPNKNFLYVKLEDKEGHEVTYSVAGAPRSDLMIVVRGTAGKPSTNGSEGGRGGEGGFPGTYKIQNAAGDNLAGDIGTLSREHGACGADGKCGADGPVRKNGHDMALVQRPSDSNPQVLGGDGQRLMEKYLKRKVKESWYSGYRRHIQGCADCYVTFAAEPVDRIQNVVTPTRQRQQQERATAAATIDLAEELHNFEAAFRDSDEEIAALCERQHIGRSITDATAGLDEQHQMDEHLHIAVYEERQEKPESGCDSSPALSAEKKMIDKSREWEEFIPKRTTSICRSLNEAVELVTPLPGRVGADKGNVETEERLERLESLRHRVRAQLETPTIDVVGRKKGEATTVSCLRRFEEALKKNTPSIVLHPTQKVSILYALESGNHHLLQQVATGEGKSLIIAAVAAVSCMLKKEVKVDIITSSPTLAMRDAERMRPIFKALDLTVAHNCSERRDERIRAYKTRIVYGTITHFQRDFLIHEYYETIRGNRKMEDSMVIVDEVDNMLLDNGNNTLYLSHSIPSLRLLDSLLFFIHQQAVDATTTAAASADKELCEDAHVIEKIRRAVMEELHGPRVDSSLALFGYTGESLEKSEIIDDHGYLLLQDVSQLHSQALEEVLAKLDAPTQTQVRDCFRAVLTRERSVILPPNILPFVRRHLDELIANCLRAMRMVENTDYVLDADRTGCGIVDLEIGVTIIDRHTGADLPSSIWAGGLHQFIEMRHACRVSPMCLKAVFISNVSYLKGYKRLRGLSGTLGSVDECCTLEKLYDADLISVPTNLPRLFHKKPPVFVDTQYKWIGAIAEEARYQLSQKRRAVLVVCETIHQLHELERGLETTVNKNTDWLDKRKIYRRQHDTFEFESSDHKVQTGQLILATNLAGRGTDIHLSEDVITAGGLHVIVAFLPPNTRVEEQAFGRAARAGQPGSAQIIAFDRRQHASNADRVRMRDEDERQRLRALNDHYYKHTVVEEKCLKTFQKEKKKVFQSTDHRTNQLPNAEDVIYHAMLDKWAFWLDEQEQAMRKFEKMEAVASFVSGVKIRSVGQYYDFPSWIDSGERLLALGIVQMSHSSAREAADGTLSRVTGDHAAFAAYYRACMRIDGFTNMRPTASSMLIEKTSPYEKDTEEALRLLKHARSLFVTQLTRRTRQIEGVLGRAARGNVECGLRAQLNSMINAYNQIISNIDWLIGAPLCVETFNEAFDFRGDAMFASMKRLSIVSPALLTAWKWMTQGEANDAIFEMQFEQVHAALGISRSDLRRLITNLSAHPKRPMSCSLIEQYCSLPSRSTFWKLMKKHEVFSGEQIVCVVRPGDVEMVAETLKEEPLKLSEDQVRFGVRFTNQAVHGSTFYSTASISASPEEGKRLLENGTLRLDMLARIDKFNLISLPSLPLFDGFTLAQMQEHLNIGQEMAKRLVNILKQSGAIRTGRNRFLRIDEGGQADRSNNGNATEATVDKLVKLDFTGIPEVFVRPLHSFLVHHCAFSLAINTLIDTLEDADDDNGNQVMLPEDPYSELMTELMRLEVISAPRFEMTQKEMKKIIDPDDFSYAEECKLLSFVNARRCKIEDSTSMLALEPFSNYVVQRSGEVDSEMRALMDIGMSVGIVSKRSIVRVAHGNILEKYHRGLDKALSAFSSACIGFGKIVGFVVNSFCGFVDSLVPEGKIIKSNATRKNIYKVTSATIDGVETVFDFIGKGPAWVVNKLSEIAGKLLSTAPAEKVAALAFGAMQFVKQFNQASIGSYRYYTELRAAACTARSTALDGLNEHKIMRFYHDVAIGVEGEKENISQLEKKLREKMDEITRHIEGLLLKVVCERTSFKSYKGGNITKPKEEILENLNGNHRVQSELDQILAYNAVYCRRLLTALANGSIIANEFRAGSDDELYSALAYAVEALGQELIEVIDEETRKVENEEKEEFDTKDYQEHVKKTILNRVAMFRAQLLPTISSLSLISAADDSDPLDQSNSDRATTSRRSTARSQAPIAANDSATRRDWLLSEFHRITSTDDHSRVSTQ